MEVNILTGNAATDQRQIKIRNRHPDSICDFRNDLINPVISIFFSSVSGYRLYLQKQ